MPPAPPHAQRVCLAPRRCGPPEASPPPLRPTRGVAAASAAACSARWMAAVATGFIGSCAALTAARKSAATAYSSFTTYLRPVARSSWLICARSSKLPSAARRIETLQRIVVSAPPVADDAETSS